MTLRGLIAAAALLASSAASADTVTLNMTGDPFVSVHLMVKVTAPNRAAYLQEGSQYKVSPDWQYVDSILCDQTTREMEVWVNPSATPRGGRMTAAFALVTGNRTVAQAMIERDMAGGKGKGFTHLADRDFTVIVNRVCR